MNVELADYRIKSLEKGLEATNDNLRDFEGVARLQGESIAQLKESSQHLNDSIQSLMHSQKNDRLGVEMFKKDSDKRFEKLEAEDLKKQGARSVWDFILNKFPAIISFLVLLFVVWNSIDIEKLTKLVGK